MIVDPVHQINDFQNELCVFQSKLSAYNGGLKVDADMMNKKTSLFFSTDSFL